VVKNILKDLVPAQNVVAANARNVVAMTTIVRRIRMGNICHAGIVITGRTFECIHHHFHLHQHHNCKSEHFSTKMILH
jgi:hypothetical protein